MHSRMYPTYRGAHANRDRMTESSERRLRAERRGKRLRFTRRRRLRTGREATLRSDEHRATGAASGGAASVHRVAGFGRGPRAAKHRPKPWGHPNCSRGTIGSEAPSSEDTGNRVSVNGARMLVRATGAGSSFGNGGRFADKTGSKGHRFRATGNGAKGCGAGQPATGAKHGHRPPSLRARRAMCRSSEG